eukprot:15325239-Ditylum_brightwellii.AAC.1
MAWLLVLGLLGELSETFVYLSGIPILLGESGMGIDPAGITRQPSACLEHSHFSDHFAYPNGICGWGASGFSAVLRKEMGVEGLHRNALSNRQRM